MGSGVAATGIVLRYSIFKYMYRYPTTYMHGYYSQERPKQTGPRHGEWQHHTYILEHRGLLDTFIYPHHAGMRCANIGADEPDITVTHVCVCCTYLMNVPL